MPTADDIQRHLHGAWRMMTGRKDGLHLLDLSVDGFWNSFFAIIVAFPPLLVSWAPLAADLAGAGSGLSLRIAIVARLAVIDLAAWTVPIALLAAIAGFAGIRDRFVHYVVATNWGAALLSWIMLPVSLIRLVFPQAVEAAAFFSIILFIASLVFSWRLTNAALEKGPMTASFVFVSMLAVSIIILTGLQGFFFSHGL